MRWHQVVVLLIVLLGCYQNHANEAVSPTMRSVLVAKIPNDNLGALKDLLEDWECDPAYDQCGIYLREIDSNFYLFLYTDGKVATHDSDTFKAIEDLVIPLPNAQYRKKIFEPMESVFFYSGATDKKPNKEVIRIAMLTGLRKEKEKDYRLLHSNPWPDVLSAIKRANLRNFSIFLEEIEGKLYLFGWLEYVGSDIEKDAAENKRDPASIRWWKETDACQIAPEDAKDGMWGNADELFFFGK